MCSGHSAEQRHETGQQFQILFHLRLAYSTYPDYQRPNYMYM